VARRAERRTNVVSLTLFVVVMTGVFAAFLVTNQQWAQIRTAQAAINERYQEAGKQIQQLTELEKQRDEMLNKAELAAALVERVPRSILLAELINRMPPQLSLLEFEMKSERRVPPSAKDSVDRSRPTAPPPKRIAGPNRAPTREEAGDEARRVEPPRYRVSVVMVGVAPTDLEVSRYLAEMRAYPLLQDPTLDYVEQREVNGRTMRQFRLSATLAADADVRHVDPLAVPRGIRNPMLDDVMIPGAAMANPASGGR
jgi:Tfp pilus assembly protein PilN